jgi:hypothetical protein
VIVAVCGLHGGAGTTTVAVLVAQAAARHAPGRVLLCDTDPGAGDLAIALGTTSPHDLAELARLVSAHRRPSVTPWDDLDGGLRLLARAPGRRDAAAADVAAHVLADAAAAHDLVVIDGGQLTASHNIAALQAADAVLWTIDATAHLDRCAQLLASDHSTTARDARWLLAASNTGRTGVEVTAAQLGELVPSLEQVVLVPVIGPLAAPPSTSATTATQQLLTAIDVPRRP